VFPKYAPFDLLCFDGPGEQPPATPPGAPVENPSQPTAQQDVLKNPAVQEALAKARREERDKLYGELDTVKKSLKTLEQERTAERTRLENEAKAAQEQARKEAIEAMSLQDQIKARQADLEKNLAEQAAAQKQIFDAQIAELQKQATQAKLQAFTATTINENGINAKYASHITGDTQEEILAKVNLVKAILADAQAAQPNGAAPAPAAGVAPGTQFPPVNAGTFNPAAVATDFSNPENLEKAVNDPRFMNDKKYHDDVMAAVNKLAPAAFAA
jgi:hypothetical protein